MSIYNALSIDEQVDKLAFFITPDWGDSREGLKVELKRFAESIISEAFDYVREHGWVDLEDGRIGGL